MNSAKWNWILLTIQVSQLLLTGKADNQYCETRKQQEEIDNSVDHLMDFINSNCLPPIKITLCNITSADWRRVAHINMTHADAKCPCGLNEASNSHTGQRACGRSVDGRGSELLTPGGCSSVIFLVNTTYSHVCGYARGYQHSSMDAFWKSPNRTIDDSYIDGLSITHGNPRKHLWTLAVGNSELTGHLEVRCPRDRYPFDFARVPDFVGNNFYCEAGYDTSNEARIAWEDPLWDGQQCVSSTAQSCSRYGWFHRQIEPSQEDIEVRWCSDEIRIQEDFYTDLLEIWVLELQHSSKAN